MRLSTTPKRAAAATLTACTLAVAVSACSSNDESQSGGLSTAATAPGEASNGASAAGQATGDAGASNASEPKGTDTASAAKTTAKNKNDNKNDNKDNKGGGDNKNANGTEVPTLVNPFAEGDLQVPTYEPISGGKEGTEEDRRQMEETVRAITNPDSFATWTRTILDNSCAAVRDPALKQFEDQGLTVDMVEQIMEQQGQGVDIPKTDVSVSDVRVDGDRASATVTSTTSGGTASQVQLFAKEDGRWKVCSNE